MEAQTQSHPSEGDSEAREESFNLPVGESTIEVSSAMSIEEMLEHFEPMRKEWMRKHYNAEERRAGMNPERFVM